MSTTPSIRLKKIAIEYENLDLPPAYVDSAQGVVTGKGILQLALYSESTKPLASLSGGVEAIQDRGSGTVDVRVRNVDPFGLDGEQVTLVRRVEANLFITERGLADLIPWLQTKLDELRRKASRQ